MYKIIDNGKTDTIGIKITSGEFADTSFRFINVTANEDEDLDKGMVNYSFEIIEGDQGLRENADFHAKMSEVLHELIIEVVDKQLSKDI
jgi:hypothetical protein